MSVIFERSASGNVKLAGGANVKVPTDRTALGVLGRGLNLISDDYDFRSDGWVYVKRKRSHKWFIQIENAKRVWEPELRDLAAIEARRWKVQLYYQDVVCRHWAELADRLKKTKQKKAHAIPLHAVKKDADHWWIWNHSDDNYGGGGVHFDWVEKPKRPINLKLGNSLYKAHQRLTTWGGRSAMFNNCLDRAVGMRFQEERDAERLEAWQTVCLNVNGRRYWYRLDSHKFQMVCLWYPPSLVEV